MSSPVMRGQRSSDPPAGAEKAYRRAWLSLALFPVSLLAAFVIGEGLASLLGYPSGSDEPAPWWVALAAGGPALLVFAAPAALAVHFGRQAVRSGRDAGKLPMWLGVGLAALFVAQNLLSYLAWVLG